MAHEPVLAVPLSLFQSKFQEGWRAVEGNEVDLARGWGHMCTVASSKAIG